MFSLKVLNRLRAGQDIVAEITSMLPNHRAYIYVKPPVDPKLATWDKKSHRWLRVFVDENILAGFNVSYVEIRTELINSFFSGFDLYGEPTRVERHFATDEKELVALVSQWLSDFDAFHSPEGVEMIRDFAL